MPARGLTQAAWLAVPDGVVDQVPDHPLERLRVPGCLRRRQLGADAQVKALDLRCGGVDGVLGRGGQVGELAAELALVFLRERYLTPLVTTGLNLPGAARVLAQWSTKGGATQSRAAMDAVFGRYIPPATPGDEVHLYKQQALAASMQYLSKHGYPYWTRYQPGSRLWPFQWIEGGCSRCRCCSSR